MGGYLTLRYRKCLIPLTLFFKLESEKPKDESPLCVPLFQFFVSQGFQFCKMKRVLGIGCTTTWMYLTPLNYILNMVKMEILCIFYHI